ncbi:MAG: hypothetical protein ACI8WT_004738 [Clostridium sp.]|jgi:hypothetical protein
MKQSECIDGLIYKLHNLNSEFNYIFEKGSLGFFLVYKESSSIWKLVDNGLHITNNKNHVISIASDEEKYWLSNSIIIGHCYRPYHLKNIHSKRNIEF